MTDQGQVPPDFFQQMRRMWLQDIAASQRAANLRNASLSAGGTLTIQGGAVVFEQADGRPIFYQGPVQPPRADGTDQPGWVVTRADGTGVLSMYDANPTDAGGALNQALNWFDRAGNVVMADDTNSGQGLGRPYIPIMLYPAALNGVTTTSATSFADVLVGVAYKQQPRLYMQVAVGNDTSGATGQVRVLVNGVVWGAVQSTSFTPTTLVWGPLAVDGAHMGNLTIEVQAQRVSGTGSVMVSPRLCVGMQS